ncbi:hypothetical protein ACFLTW_03995 [Chloroflexota bacterium]
MIGLPEEALTSILKKNISPNTYDEFHYLINKFLIPNIVEAISANNEAIMFGLKDE